MEWWQWTILGILIFDVLVVGFLMWRQPGNDKDEHDTNRGI
jgi:hypothetical protein